LSEPPAVGTEDRSKWRYENNGAPLKRAGDFLSLMKDEDPAKHLAEVKGLVTKASLPAWTSAFRKGFRLPYLNELNLVSTKVRYPADGMAYVFCLIAHPDQDEPITVEGPTQAWMHVVTLLEEDGEWKVHQIGEMASPEQVGKKAYSW
jgi:hypothetical protein